MPSWPAIDYQPLNSSLVHTFEDRRHREAPEQGAGRQRSIYSAGLARVAMQWMMSPADMETFRTFYDNTVNGGVTAFTMPIFTGSAYTNCSVNFIKGKTTYKRAEQEWCVSSEVETAQLPVMSSGALDAIIGAAPGGGALPAWPAAWVARPLERDLNITMPDPLMRSDFDDGYQPQSRVFRSAPATFEQTWVMPNAQYDAFRAWRVYRIFNGEGWFTAVLLHGADFEYRTARFAVGGLKANREGYDWLVHAKLETRDLPALP